MGVQVATPAMTVQVWVIGLPTFTLAGFSSISAGEFVCRLWFQDPAPCRVSPVTTRATMEVSTPLMRKFWPLVSKKMLPVTPGSKKATWTLSQFSRYTAPFHCRRWSRNSVFQPISLFVNLSEWYEEGTKYCGTPAGVKACGELPFWLKPPGRKPCENV